MKLVVVGGVAGGMSCAARARRLDESAKIVVLEQGEYVSYANCGLPYFVGGEITDTEALLVQTPDTLAAALDLDVRVRQQVTDVDPELRMVTVQGPEGEYVLAYDALVLAPGAHALRPPIPGLDSPRVHTLRTVDDAMAMKALVEETSRNAVVLGAGFIGVEAAEALAGQGWNVNLVELAPHVLPPMEPELATLVSAELNRIGVSVLQGIAAEEVIQGNHSDQVLLSDGTKLPADLIVLSVGVRPNTSSFAAAGIATERGAIVTDDHGQTNIPGIWAVGDATVSTDAVTGIRRPVALAGPANRAGRLVADHIINPATARPLPHPLGTAIVRVGQLTVGMTGANRQAIAQAGIEAHTIHLHPSQHAGYFPGATPVHLILHFARDGRLLGAQAVGQDGVDKRIDVLATAIRAGMGVQDLIDLDLAYSPPYGAAKDPVNLAGMMGHNVVQGDLELWYADQVDDALERALIIDVRGPAEFATGHLPTAINIPHTEIRANLEQIMELADGRPVRLICKSGMRSYLAYRILRQVGVDVATFSGGMMTLEATPSTRKLAHDPA